MYFRLFWSFGQASLVNIRAFINVKFASQDIQPVIILFLQTLRLTGDLGLSLDFAYALDYALATCSSAMDCASCACGAGWSGAAYLALG